MIRPITRAEIPNCVQVIRDSFLTVAAELGFTAENAPHFTGYAISEERLYRQFEEKRPMLAFEQDGVIVGYYSLDLQGNEECELNNLSVMPAYRHHKIGEALLQDALARAKAHGCKRMLVCIVAQNRVLAKWYQAHGFVSIGADESGYYSFPCENLQISLE